MNPLNPLTPVRIEMMADADALTRANAHAAALSFAVLTFVVIAAVIAALWLLRFAIIDALTALPSRLMRTRVDRALRADNEPRKYLQVSPETDCDRDELRRAA